MIVRRVRLLVLLLILAVAAVARAQTIPPETIDSLDVRVLNAKTVAVGHVVGISDPVPHGRYRLREVTVAVQETLCGRPESRITFTPRLPDEVLQGWERRAARLLVDVPRNPDDLGFRHVSGLDDPDFAIPTADFTVLQNPEAVVGYVRALALRHPEDDRIETFALSLPEDPEGDALRQSWRGTAKEFLRVPADARLEREARDRLDSPSPAKREEGAKALRFFRSPENAARLRPLLQDPSFTVREQAETNDGIERRVFPVRAAVAETLRSWGERDVKAAVQEDVSRLGTVTSLYWSGPLTDAALDRIASARALTLLDLEFSRGPVAPDLTARLAALDGLTELTLPPLSVGDADLAPLARLPHLRLLVLRGNPVTDAGARALAAFPPSLKVVRLDQTEATDAGLAALRAARPGLRVLPEEATSVVGAYVDRDDVEGLRRWLLTHPEEANRRSWSGGMPLHQAVEAYPHSTEIIRLLLDGGASLDALDWAGRAPLQTAIDAIAPSPEIVRLLLSRGADPNQPNATGVLPLERATLKSAPEIVRLLLDAGADPRRFSTDRLNDSAPCPACLDLIARAAAKKAGR